MVFHEGTACKHAEQKMRHRCGQGAELSAASGQLYPGHGTTACCVSFYRTQYAHVKAFSRVLHVSRSPPPFSPSSPSLSASWSFRFIEHSQPLTNVKISAKIRSSRHGQSRCRLTRLLFRPVQLGYVLETEDSPYWNPIYHRYRKWYLVIPTTRGFLGNSSCARLGWFGMWYLKQHVSVAQNTCVCTWTRTID